MNTISTQIGLGATITSIGMAVSKSVGKSSMPPVQKAGVRVAAGLFRGVTQLLVIWTEREY